MQSHLWPMYMLFSQLEHGSIANYKLQKEGKKTRGEKEKEKKISTDDK